DRAGADVGAFADGRVAEIPDVMRLRLATDLRLLQLHEIADLAVLAHVRVRSQVTERPHHRAALDDRLRQHAVGLELHAVAYLGRADLTAGADHALAANFRGHVDDHVRIDDRVRADRHRIVDVSAGGVEDGHTREHVPVEDAPALDRGQRGELLAVVHAEGFVGILDGDRLDAAARLREEPDHVRQVVLALIVLRAHVVERGPQAAAVETIDARVDLADLLLVVGRVAVFDDALDPTALAED